MGSKSKSKTSTVNRDSTILPTNNSTGDGSTVNAIGTEGSTVNLVTTDAGAVDAGRDIALAGFQFAEGIGSTTADILDRTFGTAFGIVKDTTSKSIEAVQRASADTVDAVEKANRSESTEQGRLIFVGGAVIASIAGIVMVARALK